MRVRFLDGRELAAITGPCRVAPKLREFSVRPPLRSANILEQARVRAPFGSEGRKQ